MVSLVLLSALGASLIVGRRKLSGAVRRMEQRIRSGFGLLALTGALLAAGVVAAACFWSGPRVRRIRCRNLRAEV